jgi:hypothetical protein
MNRNGTLFTLNPLIVALALMFSHGALGAENQPNSEGAATIPSESPQKNTELILRFGNESNPVDGLLGPFTYGLRGRHRFENDFAVEFGYIRLHEPKTPTFHSVLDEAQVTLSLPEYRSFIFDATVWKNRMIDLYTNLAGLEVSHKDQVSVSLGAYLGTATREEERGNFRGAQLSLSSQIGPVGLSGACLLGSIDEGSYRKCGLEGGMDFREESSFPLSVTFAIEERYFDFGNGRPRSESPDEFIFISGLEIHFENLNH